MRSAVIILAQGSLGFSASLARKFMQREIAPVLFVDEPSLYKYRSSGAELFSYNRGSLTKDLEVAVKEVRDGYELKAIVNQVDRLTFPYLNLLLRESIHVDMIDGILNSRIKARMREMLIRNDLSEVAFKRCLDSMQIREGVKDIGYPCVLKPTAGSGSRNVFKLTSDADLEKFLDVVDLSQESMWVDVQGENYDVRNEYLVEQYVQGREYTIDGFVRNGDTVIVAIHQKVGGMEGFGFRDDFYISPPMNLTPDELKTIETLVKSVIRFLGLDESLFHVEVKVSDNSKVEVIEVNPRLGGGTIRQNIINLTNVDLLDILVDIHCGVSPDVCFERLVNVVFGCGVLAQKTGTIRGISGLDEVRAHAQVTHVDVIHDIGDTVEGSFGEVYPVVVNGTCHSQEEAIALRDEIISTINVEID